MEATGSSDLADTPSMKTHQEAQNDAAGLQSIKDQLATLEIFDKSSTEGTTKDQATAIEHADTESAEKDEITDGAGDVEDAIQEPATDDGVKKDLEDPENTVQGLDPRYTNPDLLKPPEISKNKKKKSSGKKKQPKPTGFEDYYVDAPLTPAEYKEEQSLYSSEKSFADRFLLAIARYTNRRKFDEFRLKVFDRFMSYGGLSTGGKPFQGGANEKDPAMTSVDTAMLKCKYAYKFDTLEASVVDFNDVARGFLSSYLPSVQEMHRPEDFKACTNVVRNFLNYLLYHDVCPEYADQIYDAKKSCDEADVQLPICSKLALDLPGTFNQACSLLFGGYYQDIYIDDIEQIKAFKLAPGIRMDEAGKIFLAGLAAHGTESMVEAYNAQAKENKHSIKQKLRGFLEVVSVQAPSEEVLELYSLASQRGLRPTGSVKFLHWRHPTGPFPEMTPEEVAVYKTAPYDRPEYEMFLDMDLLPLMKPGTKVYCSYKETSFGLWYFDGVMSVLSPMYTYLDNEAMIDWVYPEELPWSPRATDDDDDADITTAEPGNAYAREVQVKMNKPKMEDKKDEPEEKVKKGHEDSDEDIPDAFKKYEKGEDIILTP